MGRGRGLSIMLLAVAVTAGGLPVPGGRQVLAMAPNAWPQRLAGTTRAATAAAVAEALYPQGVPTHQALLASGASANLLDALVAGPLAAAWHVPILLTNSTTALNPSTLAGLQQLGVTQVVLVGADNSPTLAAACRQAGLTVAGALGDADPQDTAASVAQALAQATHGLASTVWVTSAAPANLVDALAGGAAAASTLSPILLVPPPDNGETALPDDEARWAQAARTAFQLGVVAPAQVQGLPPSTQVVPLAGQDRFGTAARIAAQAFPRPAGLLVADGLPHHLSDAVTAAPLAAAWGAPIVLVNSDSVPASLVQRYLGALDPSLPVTTLGGTAAIPPGNLGRIQDALGATLPQHLHIVAPQGAPTPDPRFGIANAQNGPAAAAALGAGWTRIPFFWNELEPQPGQYNGFATNWDAPESQLAQAGLHLVGVIEGAPRWAEANPQPGVETAPKGLDRPWNDPANLWGQFVYRLAKHYTGLINTWIIGNEISIPQGPYATWGGTIPQFAQMIAVAYQAIHAANPAAHVLAPATPYWYAKGQVTAQLLQALSQLPGAQENHDYLDGLDVNLYNTIEYNPTIYATYQNLLQQAGVGDLPIWLTETNVAPKTSDNPQGASPTEQASFLVEQLATSFQWVQRAEAYQLQDSGGDQYGLLAADGTPRLEATAFQVLAQALDGATWLSNQLWTWKRGYPTPSTPAIATWGAPGQLIQIVWDQGFQPTTVQLPAYADTATVIDLQGHQTTVTAQDGVFSLNLAPATYNPKSFQASIGGPPLIVEQAVAPGTAGTPTAWAPPEVWPVSPQGAWQPGDAVPWSAQSGPIRVAVNPLGDQILIQDGAAQHWVTDAGPDPLQLNTPVAAAIGPNGWIYVANLGNHDVLAFLPNGRLIAAFGGYGESSGQLIGPTGIAVALDGTVYVADADRQQVLAFSPTGRPLRAWGSWGSQPGQFDGLSAVAVGPQGTVYVADTLNNRVEAYTSDGTLVGVAITPDPVALGDAGEGQVTVTDGLTGASATVSLTAATAGS